VKKKGKLAKQMEEVCLHCAFFQAHHDKWPDWRADADNVTAEAFNDLVRSAIKITAEVFSMLDESDQMIFMRNVMVARAIHDMEDKPVKEIMEAVARVLQGTTKH
jgi:hypothetical protein